MTRGSDKQLRGDTSLSPGHIRHPCGLFAAENHGNRNITVRVPQEVGLNRAGRKVQNQWPWTVERTRTDLSTDRLKHSDFQGSAGLSLILESASMHSS